jgi:hypothetical protein
MRHANGGGIGLCFLLAACATPVEGARDRGPGPALSGPVVAAPGPGGPRPDLVAWTAGGELVIADGVTGAVRQVTAEVGGIERDGALDPWGGRLLTFESDDDSGGGEIASHPLLPGPEGTVLGAREHLAWVDGRVRLLPSPFGVVVFEEGYGQRWKLLGAAPGPSVIAPPPASAWIEIGPASATVHALAGDVALERITAQVGPAGLGPPSVEVLPAGSTPPPPARLVPAPALGDAVLVDVAGGELEVRRVDSASVGPAARVPLGGPGARVEAALPIDGGEIVVLLMSSPSALTAIRLDPGGAVTSMAGVPLPGEVTQAAPFFSRDVARLGQDHVVAATSTGVYALRLTRDAGGVQLEMESAFDGSALRGPVLALEESL